MTDASSSIIVGGTSRDARCPTSSYFLSSFLPGVVDSHGSFAHQFVALPPTVAKAIIDCLDWTRASVSQSVSQWQLTRRQKRAAVKYLPRYDLPSAMMYAVSYGSRVGRAVSRRGAADNVNQAGTCRAVRCGSIEASYYRRHDSLSIPSATDSTPVTH